jgi:hypothetical protein
MEFCVIVIIFLLGSLCGDGDSDLCVHYHDFFTEQFFDLSLTP